MPQFCSSFGARAHSALPTSHWMCEKRSLRVHISFRHFSLTSSDFLGFSPTLYFGAIRSLNLTDKFNRTTFFAPSMYTLLDFVYCFSLRLFTKSLFHFFPSLLQLTSVHFNVHNVDHNSLLPTEHFRLLASTKLFSFQLILISSR